MISHRFTRTRNLGGGWEGNERAWGRVGQAVTEMVMRRDIYLYNGPTITVNLALGCQLYLVNLQSGQNIIFYFSHLQIFLYTFASLETKL